MNDINNLSEEMLTELTAISLMGLYEYSKFNCLSEIEIGETFLNFFNDTIEKEEYSFIDTIPETILCKLSMIYGEGIYKIIKAETPEQFIVDCLKGMVNQGTNMMKKERCKYC